jgi:hypothetical protein
LAIWADFEIGEADFANAADWKLGPGALLVEFVDRFAIALHAHGKVLSLDVGTYDYAWWNASGLNASALDSIADMSTYQVRPTESHALYDLVSLTLRIQDGGN